ncbi:MAG: hypothetical protein ACLQSR_04485, partial [Limisphaerales bacterium]
KMPQFTERNPIQDRNPFAFFINFKTGKFQLDGICQCLRKGFSMVGRVKIQISRLSNKESEETVINTKILLIIGGAFLILVAVIAALFYFHVLQIGNIVTSGT